MKALQSKLAKKILQSGTRIPRTEGAIIHFEGKTYTVRYVPHK